jgi:ribosomal protein L37AE/L43A
VAKPSPAKLSVECPHCGFKQMEYAAAKSTMCRQCGSHFAPSAPKVELRLKPREERVEAATSANDPSIFQKLEGFWGKHHNSEIECFDCKAKHEVSSAATSSFCPKCSTHVDLRNYKITTSFSRSIKTQGEIHVTSKGDLSSTTVTCRSALIEGKMRGNMNCRGIATINYVGKIPGRLIAENVVIDRKSDVHFFRRIQVKTIEIRGGRGGRDSSERASGRERHGEIDFGGERRHFHGPIDHRHVRPGPGGTTVGSRRARSRAGERARGNRGDASPFARGLAARARCKSCVHAVPTKSWAGTCTCLA